jgi:hypothetical protein
VVSVPATVRSYINTGKWAKRGCGGGQKTLLEASASGGPKVIVNVVLSIVIQVLKLLMENSNQRFHRTYFVFWFVN